MTTKENDEPQGQGQEEGQEQQEQLDNDDNDENDIYNFNTIDIRGIECNVYKWNIKPKSERLKSPTKGIVIFYHGYLNHGNSPSIKYIRNFLVEKSNYSVISVDMPGHGRSAGLRGDLSDRQTTLNDGKYIAETIYTKCNNTKLILIGSSLGGAIALSVGHELHKENKVKGVILLAPMLALNVSSIETTLVNGLSYILPTNVPLIPNDSASSIDKQCRCPKKRIEIENDPFTVKTKFLRLGAIKCLIDITIYSQEELFSIITCPFFILVANDDVVVNNENGSKQLYEKSPSTTDKTIKYYDALHGIMFEPDPLYTQIQNDILEWLNERT